MAALGPAGETARVEAGRRIAAIGNAENESWGIELGYAYHGSPVVSADPTAPPPPEDPLHYWPVTAPGARLPSVLLADGTPIFDRLGPWFTLLCSGDATPSAALVAEANRLHVPLAILQPREAGLEKVYGHGSLLVRPDQHIAWRGAACDDREDAHAIWARALGWAGIDGEAGHRRSTAAPLEVA